MYLLKEKSKLDADFIILYVTEMLSQDENLLFSKMDATI
jgi:hypothetical protein